jgi:hypothetical protein
MAKRSLARKTSSDPTHILVFGCQPPTEGDALYKKLLGEYHTYYNALIEIELVRRKAFRAARFKVAPTLEKHEKESEALEKELDALRDELMEGNRKATAATIVVKDGKKVAKKTKCDNPVLKARIADVCSQLKATNAKLKEERATINSQLNPGKQAFKDRVKAECERLGSTGPRTIEKVNEQIATEMLGEKKWPKFFLDSLRVERDNVAAKKLARSNCGLPPGTYLMVEAAITSACKAPTDPEPKERFEGEGRVGVQVHDLTTEQLLSGGNGMIKIDPLPATQWDTRAGRRHAYTKVHIRAGEDKDGKTIWLTFPVLLHRKLPAIGEIKWAWVRATKVGLRTRYELQLTVESPEFHKVPTGTGVLALSLCWRDVGDNNLRVGFGVDDKGRVIDGESDPEAVRDDQYNPKFMLGGWLRKSIDTMPHVLRNNGDKCFDEARNTLSGWFKTHAIPPWMLALEYPSVKDLSQWKNHAKLAVLTNKWVAKVFPKHDVLDALWQDWKRDRFALRQEAFKAWLASRGKKLKDLSAKKQASLYDEWYGNVEEYQKASAAFDLFASAAETIAWLKGHGVTNTTQQMVVYLEWWRRKNRHLYQWECDLRNKALGHRKDLYRRWAAELGRTYEKVILRKVDYRKVARKAKPEEEDPRVTAQRRTRSTAAPSEFRAALVSALGEDRVEWIVTDSLCPDCGKPLFDAPEGKETCSCKSGMSPEEREARTLLSQYAATYGVPVKRTAEDAEGRLTVCPPLREPRCFGALGGRSIPNQIQSLDPDFGLGTTLAT